MDYWSAAQTVAAFSFVAVGATYWWGYLHEFNYYAEFGVPEELWRAGSSSAKILMAGSEYLLDTWTPLLFAATAIAALRHLSNVLLAKAGDPAVLRDLNNPLRQLWELDRGRAYAWGLHTAIRTTLLAAFFLGSAIDAPQTGHVPLYCLFAVGAQLLYYRQMTLTRRPEAATAGRISAAVLAVVAVSTSFYNLGIRAIQEGVAAPQQRIASRSLSPVTLYSERSMQFEGGLKRLEQPLGGEPYRFRYDGLVLVTFADGKYVLVPADWTPGTRLVIVQDNDSIRVEIGP